MPASYPTAVKSFTVKSDGDTIQPSHINDLQDEVAAIEAGLLNGTAPLNSSNSTVANLTVTGGSTLASLQVAGNCTIAGTLTVTTIISTSVTAAGTQTSFFRGRLADPVEFSTLGAWSTLAFPTKVVDLSSEWNSTTRRFTAASSGTYLINLRAYIPYQLGWTLLSISVDDAELSRSSRNDTGAIELALQNEVLTNLNAGQTISFQVYHAGGSTGRVSTLALTEASVLKLF